FEPRPDALPACQGLLERGAVVMQPAVGPREAGGGPQVLLCGWRGSGEKLAGAGERGEDCSLGGERPGVGVVVPVLGVAIPGQFADAEPGEGGGRLLVPAVVQRD